MADVEVTAEMVEAGLKSMLCCDPPPSAVALWGDLMTRAYLAMRALEPSREMRVGAVVRRGPLGYLMTVVNLVGEVAYCVWSDGEDVFPVWDLEVIS